MHKFDALIKTWGKRNISGIVLPAKEEACARILEMIPLSSAVGFSGSLTLEELGIIARLEARGSKVYNQYRPGISRPESMEIRMRGALADYYLASANAIAESGELIFLSAYGHRIVGIASAKNVIVVCGVNKIVATRELALKRAREFATPLNCKRLSWNAPCLKDGICHEKECLFPEFKRMCCQLLVIEAEVTPDRLKVILVEENLGY